MLRVAVRRFRPETIGIVAVLAGVGLLALVTGRSMDSSYHSSGLADCLAGGSASQCRDLVERFGERFNALQVLIVPLVLLPALLGAFVGAPLVARELEAGTHRFLWTQGVTRERWFTYTAAVAVTLTLVAGALYALIAGAWLDTTNAVTGERFNRLYDFQGVVPIGAAAFAVAVGIACGVIIRRTVPAMVATLGIFIGVRVFTAVVLRPHFMSAKTLDLPFGQGDPLGDAGAWVLSETIFDGNGVVVGTGGNFIIRGENIAGLCPNLRASGAGPAPENVDECLSALGYHTVFKYHSADRFWTFQLIETGLLLGLACVAITVAALALRRRTA
jgi:ABC-type transport system involved in multi-copper enzyme maturation permease subunit